MSASPNGTGACGFSDAVVAHFLDGALEDTSWEQAEALRRHREDCEFCRAALLRARRLDALVASTADPAAALAHGEVWLDEALVRAAPPVALRRRPARRVAVRTALAIAVGIAAGVSFEHLSGVRPEPQRVREAAAPATEIDSPPRPPEPREITVALRNGRLLGKRSPSLVDSPAAARQILVSPQLWLFAWPFVAWRGGVAADAHAVARAARARAAAALAERRSEWGTLAELCAELPDDERLAAALDAARRVPGFQSELVRGVERGERSALRVAGRVGGERLDRALLTWTHGETERVLDVATAIASVADRPDRAPLLLALWSVTEARHSLDDPLGFAERLWVRATASDVRELTDVLSRSHDACERARILWSLAAIRAPSTASALADVLESRSRTEAVLAAFALGRLPSVDVAPPRGGGAARALWLAARASAGDPAVRPLLRELALSNAEASLLLAGDLSPAQIDAASRLLLRVAWRGD